MTQKKFGMQLVYFLLLVATILSVAELNIKLKFNLTQSYSVRTAITIVVDIKMVLTGIIGPGKTVVLFDPQAHT